MGRIRQLDGGMDGAQETMVLPTRRQGLRTSTACANSLRLQRRFRQLAGRVVGTQKSLVLPAPGQRLRSNPMPHDPVTGPVVAVALASATPSRKHRAPSSGVHVLGVALVPCIFGRVGAALVPASSSGAK